MQPQEFNAFVAAIVSARGANLMSSHRAQEIIECAATRAGFKPQVSIETPSPDVTKSLQEALNGRL